MSGIVYCELKVDGIQFSSKRILFEFQGKLLGFEFLFIMILLFVMNH